MTNQHLEALYSRRVLSLAKEPSFMTRPTHYDLDGEAISRLCGAKISLQITLNKQKSPHAPLKQNIEKITYQADCDAFGRASCALLRHHAHLLTLQDLVTLGVQMRRLTYSGFALQGEGEYKESVNMPRDEDCDISKEFRDILEPTKLYPHRIPSALLVFDAIDNALLKFKKVRPQGDQA